MPVHTTSAHKGVLFPRAKPAPSASRPIPRWAAGLLAELSQTVPAVLTLERVKETLCTVGSTVSPESAVRSLVRLGWLEGVGLRGVWEFLPPGVEHRADPYVALRAWRALEPNSDFCLAGDNAAWHLGYLSRVPERVTVWLKPRATVPKGLRGKVETVRTRFSLETTNLRRLHPSGALLTKRRLDLIAWASGLPAFGPEALLVQVAQRPASFHAWVDLTEKLGELARDIEMVQLSELIKASTNGARQRAAYLLHLGGRGEWRELLPENPQPVEFGEEGPAKWHAETAVNDHLLHALVGANAKA